MASKRGDLSQYELKGVEKMKKEGDSKAGSGSYGFVFEVKVKGDVFIAKKPHNIFLTKSTPEERTRVASKFREECVLLSQLKHPNIVEFVGVYYDDRMKTDLVLVMKKLHRDLLQFLADNPQAEIFVKLSILKDVASGLVYLHERSPPVVHRDLTAMNVLLTTNNQAKIADLGVAKLMNNRALMASRHTRVPGQMYYMPPETLIEKALCTPKLDVFSFGHLILHTIIGNFPEVFDIPHKEKREGIIEQQKRQQSLEVMGSSHCLYELTLKCIRDSPKDRPNARELHEYVEKKTEESKEVRLVRFYDPDGKYGEFTNSYPCSTSIDGCTWKNIEHYIQDTKVVASYRDVEYKLRRTAEKGVHFARQEVVRRLIRPDWNLIEGVVMRKALLHKFSQNEALKQLLLDTGNKRLIYHTKSDSYWGCGRDDSGTNKLGMLLMDVREAIRMNEAQTG